MKYKSYSSILIIYVNYVITEILLMDSQHSLINNNKFIIK